MTHSTRLLFYQNALHVFRNRMYDSEAEARDCPEGNMRLIENSETGLVRNEAIRTGLGLNVNYLDKIRQMTDKFYTHVGVSA